MSPARRSPSRRERGASTVLVALMLPIVFAAAALAIDISRLAYERQDLADALDAAAQAGAYALPNDTAGAQAAALAFAAQNDPGSVPNVSFWCVIASTGAAKTPNTAQIPSTCNPGTITGARCNEQICAIPCTPGAGRTCNTIKVDDEEDVPFSFAPVIGIDTGSTGALSSAACKGSCGSELPNPMDVVIVGDRTGSMSASDLSLMKSAITSTLLTMTTAQQYVSFGTIHRSATSPGTCITTASTSATAGPWIPVPFSNNYLNPPATLGGASTLNTSSTLVRGVNCLATSSQGTYLASPMKAAARYVLGLAPNNLGSLPARELPPRKVIIFETDGEPNENNITGSTSLSTSSDIGSTNGQTACNNLSAVATNAKNQGVLIVTVGFGGANSARCASGGSYVRNVLAAAASPDATGAASDADNDCSTAARRTTENSDGDYFFCAAGGSELASIFVSAVSQLSPNTRLLRLP